MSVPLCCICHRVPTPVLDEQGRIYRAQQELSAASSRPPSCGELSAALDIPTQRVQQFLMLQARGEVRSLDAPQAASDHSSGSLGETVAQVCGRGRTEPGVPPRSRGRPWESSRLYLSADPEITPSPAGIVLSCCSRGVVDGIRASIPCAWHLGSSHSCFPLTV